MLSEPTSDHKDVFVWAKTHDAVPAEVLSEPGLNPQPVLSFLFLRQAVLHDRIRPISWDEFFAVFDVYELTFTYEKQPSSSLQFELEARPIV